MAGSKKKYGGLQDMFNLRYCDLCNTDFIVPDSRVWTYKKQVGKKLCYFCSYGCMREYLKQKGAK